MQDLGPVYVRTINLLISEHALYRALDRDESRRRKAFACLVDQILPDDIVERIRAAANANAALGSDDFLARMAILAGRDVDIPRRGRPRRVYR